MARTNSLIKVGIALAALGGLGFLFVQSAHNTRSTPYTIARAHLQNWRVVFEPAASGNAPALLLRPPDDLTSGLFHEVFARTMESLSMSTPASVPLLLKGEYDRAFADAFTPEALVEAARTAGLESAPFEPRCLALRRLSSAGSTRQLFFVLFDAPAFGRFREDLARSLSGTTAASVGFDPAALSPVLLVASTDRAPDAWQPLRADATTDCVAPIVAQ